MSLVFSAEDLGNLDDPNKPLPTGGDNGVAGAGGDGGGDSTSTGASSTVTANEFRYGDDAPEELRGKTPTEAMQLYVTAKEVARNSMAALSRMNNQPNQPAQPAAPAIDPNSVKLTSEDLLGTNPDSVNAKLDKLFEMKAAPVLGSLYQNMANNAYTAARSMTQHFPYFQKYEQEIMQVASRLPAASLADVNAWGNLYRQVVGMHYNEILEEEVQKRLSEQNNKKQQNIPPMERGGSSNSPATGQHNLTQEELMTATMLGVEPKEYANYKRYVEGQ